VKENKVDTQKLAKIVDEQAKKGDEVCQDYLSEVALNSKRGGGFSWIEMQLDMEDEDDDFRPY